MIEFNQIPIDGVCFIIVIILSLIKIPKIQLNLWGIIGKSINSGIQKDLGTKLSVVSSDVGKLTKTLDKHIFNYERESVRASRFRVLRFSDDLINNNYHSAELFDEILAEIDNYEKYCNLHPEYQNNKAKLAIANIKKCYAQRLEDDTLNKHNF